jgi:hypothetical protein
MYRYSIYLTFYLFLQWFNDTVVPLQINNINYIHILKIFYKKYIYILFFFFFFFYKKFLIVKCFFLILYTYYLFIFSFFPFHNDLYMIKD